MLHAMIQKLEDQERAVRDDFAQMQKSLEDQMKQLERNIIMGVRNMRIEELEKAASSEKAQLDISLSTVKCEIVFTNEIEESKVSE
jgi:hypothetical protein